MFVFFCNGKKVVDKHVDPQLTLLTYLRTKLLLTGSKLGCGEGGCGACTVMLSRYSAKDQTIRHFAVNACLIPICYVHGMAVTTVEGIGSTKTRLHPVQERLAKAHGCQCGFCTPGFVMSMYTLLRNNPQPTMEEIESAFEGNLCRCTGYRAILQGYKSFTKEGCCGSNKNSTGCSELLMRKRHSHSVSTSLFDPSEFVPYDPSQEPIFPPELMLRHREEPTKLLKFVSEQITWFRPVTVQQVLDIKDKYPEAKMVVGNSEIGVEVKFKDQVYPVLIDVNHIPALTEISTTPTGVKVGASVSLTELNHFLPSVMQAQPEHKTRLYAAIVEMLRWFAGHQIRNVASLGGNIATGSPISDLNPLLMASMSTLQLASQTGTRTVTMDGNFFTGYRKSVIGKDEVIVTVDIPFTSENEYFYGYKQASRREDDVSIVNAGMRVIFKPGSNVVADCTLAYGGMAPTTVLAKKTMKAITGRKWEHDLVEAMYPTLGEDLPLPPGAPGGMEPYRQSLTLSFFFKFYLTVLEQISLKMPGLNEISVPTSYKTATQSYQKHPAMGVQMYQEVPPGQPESDAVGRPLTHQSALKQATGEALYVDDLPTIKGELYLGLVLSKKAHANILSVDTSAALAVDGVHAFVDVGDVPGSNELGATPIQDDLLFAEKEVTCVGQVIGVVVADNKDIAQRAARLVEVRYDELPAIITIEDAIERGSFFPCNLAIKKGNVEEALVTSECILEGEMKIGGQDHFYLETMSTLVIPGEGGEVEVISSSQWPTLTQKMVAMALGVPNNKVVSRVKRIGGAFGGKASRSGLLAAMCAVAANKVNRPVRLMLDRDEDMVMTGIRHPFLGRYKTGFTRNGRLTALQIDLYNNGGNTMDLSSAVIEKALFNMDNCYKIPNVRVSGHPCKTNIASNTGFRGFGGPEANMMIESILHTISIEYGLSPIQIREMNFYKEGDRTYFGQELKNWNLDRCWSECIRKSDFHRRKQDVDEFNRKSRWKKRGIAMTPAKYGIAYTHVPMNQAGALVHVYTDGTVLVTHAGTEMGQGLHTKMIQVASRTLRISPEKIHISETSTNTVPNTSPTAGSTSSDLNGMAVKEACETILHRLEPFIHNNPKGTWESWINAAYLKRVSLSSTGFYKTPDLHFNWETGEGRPFNYFTYGVAVSEVEIDCLTGDHQVLRTDIVMDVGDSINPAVDVGQIEGGFVQGYGWLVLEDYRMTPTGHLLTKGPGFYKIPGVGDIPKEFNISLLTRAPNSLAICSSKGIGEPPVFLAASVFFAIKDAIQSARDNAGLPGVFHLNSPATAERIRMACQDRFTQQVPQSDPGTHSPFFVRP
ncbi:xanthine dehydrogenase/oxidase-like [Acanthaster planci]|uniref:xanthine dehydrogenase n=1 Tax=Acanthaster planci TaxID=133434 RepID=A0A8B7YMZ1_ACAPL|nr:xanthine dehydrogenase/oxidase-like [Acanthaster planci]